MTEDDRRALIEAAVPAGAAAWVELGSGRGVFTSTLAGRLGKGARILSIDRDRAALAEQHRALGARHAAIHWRLLVADIANPVDLGRPDGVLAANALHYLAPGRRAAVLRRLRSALSGPGEPGHAGAWCEGSQRGMAGGVSSEREGPEHEGPERSAAERVVRRPGRLVVIEYDTPRVNPWVPYPLPLHRLRREALEAGFAACDSVARVEGSFGRSVYAAVCLPERERRMG